MFLGNDANMYALSWAIAIDEWVLIPKLWTYTWWYLSYSFSWLTFSGFTTPWLGENYQVDLVLRWWSLLRQSSNMQLFSNSNFSVFLFNKMLYINGSPLIDSSTLSSKVWTGYNMPILLSFRLNSLSGTINFNNDSQYFSFTGYTNDNTRTFIWSNNSKMNQWNDLVYDVKVYRQ